MEVTFWNNDERAQSGEDYVKEFVLRYRDKILPSRFSDIKAKAVDMHGTKAFRFTYEDGGTGGIPGGVVDIDDLMEELRRRRSGVQHGDKPGKPRRHVEFLIVDYDGTFSIRASAEKEEFPKHEKTFYSIAECFEPIHERRW